jgi:hypothetical protein
VGGAGDDQLFGNGGRDLLIGGLGADALAGNGGEDALIGGSTDRDGDPDGLLAQMASWRSAEDHATRVEQLRLALAVADDGENDTLNGGGGRDLFFAGLADGLVGLEESEQVVS